MPAKYKLFLQRGGIIAHVEDEIPPPQEGTTITEAGHLAAVMEEYKASGFTNGWGAAEMPGKAVEDLRPAEKEEVRITESQSDVPFCQKHGVAMELREGVGKESGKPYRGFFCPESRDCQPVWVK